MKSTEREKNCIKSLGTKTAHFATLNTTTFTVYILIICSNSTILCLIWIQKSLHEPMYIFIAALLCNALLFSTNVYPKLLIDLLSDLQVTTYSSCRFQAFIYYSLSGSEFLLLAVMAYDRYVSICKPLQYLTIMRKTTVTTLLVLAWVLPSGQLIPPLILGHTSKLCNHTLNGIFCNNAVTKLSCMVYGLIVLLNIGIFPMLFIVFTYTKIIIIAYKSCREARKKAVQTCLPHLLVLLNYSILITYDVIIVQLGSDIPRTVKLLMSLQIITFHPLCNPLIYGLKLKTISSHLKTLFSQIKWSSLTEFFQN
uniref:Olfactory receptor n=1 Tax=Cyprinodon variegatus TaxID=28743 RepID=A0A3Q2CXZ0_CYPVA